MAKGEVTKTPVEWHVIEIDFRPSADMRAVSQALEPPDDLLANMRVHPTSPLTLEGKLLAWGWAPAIDGHYRRTGRLGRIGVYGDWTWLEDDERFMPLIAPWVVPGSRAIYKLARLKFEWYGIEEDLKADLVGWDFDGSTVVRRRAELVCEYGWMYA